MLFIYATLYIVVGCFISRLIWRKLGTPGADIDPTPNPLIIVAAWPIALLALGIVWVAFNADELATKNGYFDGGLLGRFWDWLKGK